MMGDCDPEEGTLHVFINEVSHTFVVLTQGCVFLPVTLLAGCTSFIVCRWRDWMVNCHTMQGNIHDIGVIGGGSFASPPSLEQRKLLFQFVLQVGIRVFISSASR
jgi:hypothetical protein